ncbi:PorP/SprF family type IX secretion system membrane protein [Chryseolinea lacunae]|uniref:PorP/SprF family type IX secretion system membrane protein n=1 Tax=Chryseolinea lacunae TaxID=2801331 RepID=A0ABS1KZZ8_9BACT|nr:PorP/SprF family type IX secretion system membrane protein [Chryseolinea lacunae]MBL0744247.1 PorP/SprF family type IX secretion system membrane protein [Chryseolinea lacunae]
MLKFFTIVSVLLLASLALPCAGQQYPFYTQWIFNPYTINPSMVAAGRRTEANITYRQQWTQIQDGPRTLQFDIQHPLDSRMAIGLNVYDDRTVLVSATSAMLTFGYKVPLATDHSLGFGISAGVFSNRIRLNDITNPIDLQDPALLSTTSNNFSFDGQFGVNYTFKSFVLGFSMLKLVDHKTLSQESFQKVSLSPLKNKNLFATYRFTLVPDTWALQPSISYRFNDDDVNFYEASAFVSYKGVLDVGGGYRQYFGPSAMLRVHVKDIAIGYAYDFPSPNMQVSTGGSNEVQVKWRFGRSINTPSKKPSKESAPARTDEDVAKAATKTVDPEKTDSTGAVSPTDNAVAKTENAAAEPKRSSWEDHMEVDDKLPGQYYYLIVGTFKKQSNANKLVRYLADDGVTAEVKKVDDYYYVHISKYKTKIITLDRVMEIRHETQFADAWYKRLE